MTEQVKIKKAIPEDIDVSGMAMVSTFFEECVRKMIIAGMEWLEAHPQSAPRFGRVIGADVEAMTSTNAAAATLQVEMLKAAPKGSTADMMKTAVNNVRAAKILGWDRYLEHLQEGRCF